jgi:hypothetical protein
MLSLPAHPRFLCPGDRSTKSPVAAQLAKVEYSTRTSFLVFFVLYW